MELRPSSGNEIVDGRFLEDDVLNVIWVVDSNSLPFYRAEQYHQFHNGLGHFFPASYLVDLKARVAQLGRIDPTGCPEGAGFFF